MNDLLPFLLGGLLIAGGILGKRFVVGLSARVKASPWYGRTWLIGSGLLLVGGGVSRLVKGREAPLSESFWSKGQCFFYGLFETYNGVGLAVGGLLISAYYFRQRNWKVAWIFLAVMVGGAIFAYDGIWSLVSICSR